MKDKVSNIISISGIPKTDSVDQVILKEVQLSVNMINLGIVIAEAEGCYHLGLSFFQILGAFAVRDGVPMQGIKIQNVVPGKN